MAYIDRNGTRIYYETHGPADGAPVVLLHGLGSSAQDWSYQIPALAAYRVVAVDVRGHGQSDKPAGPYSVAQFAGDVIAVLDALALPAAHLVGLSMGGMIAFQLAADFPERVKSMVIVNSAPALVPATLGDRLKVWTRFLIVRLLGMRRMGETLAPRLFTDVDQEAERQLFITRWAANNRQAYLASMSAIVGWSVQDRIGGITAPVLVVAADQDYTPVSVKEAYIAQLPNASLKVIANAHHAVPVERPEAFNAVLLAFLDAVASGG